MLSLCKKSILVEIKKSFRVQKNSTFLAKLLHSTELQSSKATAIFHRNTKKDFSNKNVNLFPKLCK
jgi:hypothetical protein